MTERYAVGYVRRSAADDSNPGEVSREAQEAAIEALAARDGIAEPVKLYADWGKSADEAKEAKRAAFLSMLSAIERGEVSAVYAASLDRLYRSMRTFVRLTDAAKAHDTRIVTQREGVLGGDGSPMARAFAEITAVFSSLELNTIKARNHAAQRVRKDRGDRFGVAPYGKRVVRDAEGRALKPIRWEEDPDKPIAPVLEAYRRAGTVLGACRLMDDTVPTAHAGGKWHPSALTLILAREGVLPPRGRRQQISRSAVLAGLLRCHCGTTLTPDIGGKKGYYCRFGHWRRLDVHASGPAFVREDAILPTIRAEADRLSIPFDAAEMGQDDATTRSTLAERKRRLGMAFVDRLLEEDDYRAELAKLADEVDRLDAAAEVVELSPLDWSQPAEIVNGILRAMFWPIQLDREMRIPVTDGRPEIRWRVPEWRA
jgi:DNA invertase Pin-like site-specific DNA recombinase